MACATFNIQDQARQKFWLPKGMKNILQKYGGKPVSISTTIYITFVIWEEIFVLQKKRVGKFLRKTASVPIGETIRV